MRFFFHTRHVGLVAVTALPQHSLMIYIIIDLIIFLKKMDRIMGRQSNNIKWAIYK